jgi:hypothetical protein
MNLIRLSLRGSAIIASALVGWFGLVGAQVSAGGSSTGSTSAGCTCVKPAGTEQRNCCEVTGTRPSLPSSGGGPETPRWGSDRNSGPSMSEDDSTSPDDDMGSTSTQGDQGSASTTTSKGQVCNENGDLSGPNGTVQNGGGEGDCIEVKICWWYYDGWGDFRQVCSPPLELCPCE